MRGCDLELHVARAGTGPLVVLLHGFPENWSSWRHQIPALVDAGFSVMAPDMRGYNESDRPAERDAYILRNLIDDVAALVRANGNAPVHIIGHDWGGVVAWTFAGAYPELTSKLVILNAPHLRLYRRAMRRGTSQLLRAWYVALFLIPRVAEGVLSRNNFAILRRIFERGPARPNAFTADEIEQYVNAAAKPGALTAMLNYYRALRDPGAQAIGRAAVAECETLVIWGDLDRALSVRVLDGIESVAPTVTVHHIPDAGHWVQNEAPDEVNGLITAFLLAPPPETPSPSEPRMVRSPRASLNPFKTLKPRSF